MTPDQITAIAAAVSAATTIVLAFLTFRYVRLTNRLASGQERWAEVQVLSKLIDDYAGPEMLAALRLLNDFKAKNGTQFAQTFGQLRDTNYATVKDVDEARRRVKMYYFRVYALLEAPLERFKGKFLPPFGRGRASP